MLLAAAFDLIVIGSGPAGRRAAVEAAKLGKRTALIERGALGGVSTNAGTVPARTLRAAAMELSGNAFRMRPEITIDDLLWRTQQVIEHEQGAIADELRRSGVRVLEGSASFVGPHTLEVRDGASRYRVRAQRIVIAVGTAPDRPAWVDFDDRTVLDTEGILGLADLPKRLTVVGGRVVGLEFGVHGCRARRPRDGRRREATAARLRRRRAGRGAPVPPSRARACLPARRAGGSGAATPVRSRDVAPVRGEAGFGRR